MFSSFVQRVTGVVGLALCCCAFTALADPPQHVGRVVFTEGEVVLVPAAGEAEVASPTNYPLVAGALVRTRGPSGAELEFSGLRLWLAGDTQLAVLQTEAAAEAAEAGGEPQPALQFSLAAGALVARLDAQPRMAPRIESAGGLFELKGAGNYRIDSTGTAATVVVRKGLLRIDAGGGLSYLTDGQRVDVADGVLGVTEYGAPAADDFDRWVAARQAPAEPTPRYVSSQMPGWRELNTYGTWEQSADYGPVWVPSGVPAGWVPYRDGEWVWLPPWGWTWIDRAPWGFAPFHFGRWAHHHGRWCWVPGTFVRPVFAPGLVHFFDGKNGATKHPRADRPQRWAPLTPHDKFVPTFPASGRFADRVNEAHGRWLGRGVAVAPTANPPVVGNAGSALPAAGRAPAFAPVLGPTIAPTLGPGRASIGDLPRRSGRDVVGLRGGFVPPPAVAAPRVVVPAPAASLPVEQVIPARRDEGGRGDWHELGARQRHWPPREIARPAGIALPVPANVTPSHGWRSASPAPAASATTNPPAATNSANEPKRRFGNRDGERAGWSAPMRGGGRRF